MTAEYLKKFNEYCADGIYFEHVISAIYKTVIQEGDVALDGGASHGLHTLPLSKAVGKFGHVYAFEAIPPLADQLKENYKSIPNITIFGEAISDFKGKTEFHFVKNNTGYSGINKRGYPEDAEVELISVPVTTVDALLPNVEKVSFIKLDLEGGEFKALKGAQSLISRNSPLIVFEHGGKHAAKFNNYSIDDYSKFWAVNGYQIFDLFGKPILGERFSEHDVWYFIAAKTERHIELIENIHVPIIHGVQTFLAEEREKKKGWGLFGFNLKIEKF